MYSGMLSLHVTGKQVVTAHCHRNHREEVDPAYCDGDVKPGTGIFPCNTDPCEPR